MSFYIFKRKKPKSCGWSLAEVRHLSKITWFSLDQSEKSMPDTQSEGGKANYVGSVPIQV